MTIRVRHPVPHAAQRRVLDEARRFNVVCCGRRWGKSKLGIYLFVRAITRREPMLWFSPTYKMLMDAWREFIDRLAPVITAKDTNDKRVELLGGASLEFFSLDAPDGARGRKAGLVGVDEAAIVDNLSAAFQQVIRPALADLRGSAWFFSTPRGFNDFYNLFALGQDPEEPEWASWQMPTSENPAIHPDEIEAARRMMDPEYFAQEFLAQFTAKTGRVYHTFSRAENARELADPGGTLLVGMDFNVDPMSAVIAARAGDELHVFDEVELHNSGTEEMARAIKDRYPDRPICVYPDPSGVARKTAAPVGQTDFTLLRAAGFDLKAPRQAWPVADRVNNVRALCCNAAGRRRLLVSHRCKRLIQCMDQLSYKDATSIIDKSQGYDHLTDALGYLVSVEFPIITTSFEEREVFGL